MSLSVYYINISFISVKESQDVELYVLYPAL